MVTADSSFLNFFCQKTLQICATGNTDGGMFVCVCVWGGGGGKKGLFVRFL